MSIQELLESGVAEGLFPGAAASVNGTIHMAGRFAYDAESPLVTADSLWDIASLTKVVSTTTLSMMAVENGLMDLNEPAAAYWPAFKHPRVTIRHLMLHRSGLPPYLELWRDCRTPEEGEAKLLAAPVRRAIPPRTIYSCTGFLVLRRVLENVYSQPLERSFQEMVGGPLGLSSCFNPTNRKACVPTSRPPVWRASDEAYIQGIVHDPAAFIMGGVSGNAGLFASLRDLASWVSALTSGQLVRRDTLNTFATRADAFSTRGLGFDTQVPGARGWSVKSFGHTGYTGTTIWIDPTVDRSAILLTNRVHPDDTVDLKPFRIKFHEAASRLS